MIALDSVTCKAECVSPRLTLALPWKLKVRTYSPRRVSLCRTRKTPWLAIPPASTSWAAFSRESVPWNHWHSLNGCSTGSATELSENKKDPEEEEQCNEGKYTFYMSRYEKGSVWGYVDYRSKDWFWLRSTVDGDIFGFKTWFFSMSEFIRRTYHIKSHLKHQITFWQIDYIQVRVKLVFYFWPNYHFKLLKVDSTFEASSIIYWLLVVPRAIRW